MKTEVIPAKEHKIQSVSNDVSPKRTMDNTAVQFEDNRPEAAVQTAQQEAISTSPKVTQPSITSGVNLDLLGNLSDLSISYTIEIFRKELTSYPVLQIALTRALSYSLEGTDSLQIWIGYVRKAYEILKGIAAIPRGIVAAFLWGVGKVFLSFANLVYNKGKLASLFGEITEERIYTLLDAANGAHAGLLRLIKYAEQISANLLIYSHGGNEEETQDKSDTSKETKEIKSPSFISLNIETPELTKWQDKEGSRAGLNAIASAHLSLLGQHMGGDMNVKLPFGPGWQIEIENFFKSSSISLTGLSIGNISGESLVFNNNGLVSAAMSINDLSVSGDIVKAEKIQVTYNAADQNIVFEGQGSAELWDGKRLEGSIYLELKKDGEFEKADITVKATETFSAIPTYLDITNPEGAIVIYNDKAPDMDIKTGIKVKNLPGGITADGKGGIKYTNASLQGYITDLDIIMPIGKKAKLTIGIINADFNAEEVTAENASIKFDYDQNAVDETHANPGTEAKSILRDDLSWIDVSKFVDLQKLSLHQGVKNLNLKAGKLGYVKDGKNGLRLLSAKVFGLTANYDDQEKKGTLEGSLTKELSARVLQIDFPVTTFAGAYVEVEGSMQFMAGLNEELAKNEDKSTSTVTAVNLSGQASASAGAKLTLAAGAFIGFANIATLKGGVFGSIKGQVDGNLDITGNLLYNSEKTRFSVDKKAPPTGNFNLQGVLTAEMGAELKAQVLVFEKKIASTVIGDWELGSYQLMGHITSDGKGMPSFVIDKHKFGSKPKAPNMEPSPMPLEEWIAQVSASGKKIKLDSDKRLKEAARDLVYGSYTEAYRTKLKTDFASLLRDPADQQKFEKSLTMMTQTRQKNPSHSFIWSAALWNTAVNRRTNAFGGEQSKSKAIISDLIQNYHSSKPQNRLAELEKIRKATTIYIGERSKSKENKVQAGQLLNQIKLEEAKIAHEQPDHT